MAASLSGENQPKVRGSGWFVFILDSSQCVRGFGLVIFLLAFDRTLAFFDLTLQLFPQLHRPFSDADDCPFGK